jgi:SOS-response transcriptional repressor LexA
MTLHKSGLTTDQRILLYVQEYNTVHQQSPSYREIAAGVGISLNGLQGHIESLCDKGYLAHNRQTSRSIRLIRPVAFVFDRKEAETA